MNKPETLEKWQRVVKHPHSDTQRKDILRIAPLLEVIIRKPKKANKKKTEVWQTAKFKNFRT